jgi:hypothetical protein
MSYDALNTFKRGALDLPVATTYSDVIPMGESGVALDRARLFIQITDAVTSAGASTTQFILQKDDNEAFASPTTVKDSGALAKATLVDDYVVFDEHLSDLDWQEAAAGAKTWLRVAQINAVAALTAGDVFEGIIEARPNNNVG